jgi:hypothetical protein
MSIWNTLKNTCYTVHPSIPTTKFNHSTEIKNYKQTMVSIGDAKINTIVVGSGPPLVLLHGESIDT